MHNPFIRQKAYFTVLEVLDSILREKGYPDKLLAVTFREEKFSHDEKAVIVDLVYGILRHRARIDHIIEHASSAVIPGLNPDILNIMRICTYQAVFTDASNTAVMNNAVALSSREDKFRGFIKRSVEGVLRNKDRVIFPDPQKDLPGYISAYHSHPACIVEKWLAELGHEVESLCRANNLKPPLMIRVNPLKSNREALKSSLESEGYASSLTAFSPFGLIVDKKEDIFKTEAFGRGAFEVQDEGSQLLTLLAGVKPGELVIDACAGNGGKSLFLSGLMKNRGTVVAFETHEPKLANLRRRADRAGASGIKTARIKDAQEYNGLADCVFIDAPCSGMGVFRRNPDSKWHLTLKDIKELAVKQKEILREYKGLVKPGGRLVYATCTISREENEEVVLGFIEENKDFYLVPVPEVNPVLFGRFATQEGFFRSLPHVHNTDGFFGAVMNRKGT